MKSMYVNVENLKAISEKLRNKIKEIDDCYTSIKTIVKDVDGTNDNWFGNEQKIFYNNYLNMSKEYPKNIEKLNEFYQFLCGVIKDYEERDKDISNDVDVNTDNLDV